MGCNDLILENRGFFFCAFAKFANCHQTPLNDDKLTLVCPFTSNLVQFQHYFLPTVLHTAISHNYAWGEVTEELLTNEVKYKILRKSKPKKRGGVSRASVSTRERERERALFSIFLFSLNRYPHPPHLLFPSPHFLPSWLRRSF